MSLENKLKKIQESFYEYDFTDSIIEKLYFDEGLVNFFLHIDYYFTEDSEEQIKLTFKNCTEVKYEIPQKLYEMNNNSLNVSHFTITKIVVTGINNQLGIKIFTVDNETELLKILCEDVSFERLRKE